MSIGVSFLCILANLPDPHLYFSNFTFQLWPIDRRKCPGINPYLDSLFHLYTPQNVDTSKIITPFDDHSLQTSGIDFARKTIIFFHGFLESHTSSDAQSIKNAYLKTGNYNVILAQNQRLLAGPDYITAASNCKPIGQFSAAFIDYLISKGLKLKDLHVIGLSLGGQIAGFTGKFLKSGKLPRITALDPAGPLFNLKHPSERLDPTDAEFVDVIHTNAALFGIKYSVGHADFWPNGGRKQPGCQDGEKVKIYGLRPNWLVFCDHYRSYQLYVKTILSPNRFFATKCNGNLLYKFGLCDDKDGAFMGIAANRTNKGDYYINTGLTGVQVGFTELV